MYFDFDPGLSLRSNRWAEISQRLRRIVACDRMDVNPETSAVREIIDDALNGRRVFAETKEHTRAA